MTRDTIPMCNEIAILVHRSPLELARSLRARDGLPIPIGIALWEAYGLKMLRMSGRPKPCWHSETIIRI